jgi:hypothetical protein
MTTIDELVDFALNNPDNLYSKIDIGCISDELAQNIKEFTNFELHNYLISIDSYAILHTLNHHGLEETENLRGQEGITKQDFSLLLDIVFYADKISDAGKGKDGKNAILFEKTIDNLYHAVFEIRTIIGEKKKLYKQSRIMLKTYYKHK